eukprot:CAMPEP_0184663780 /NCGR_PEP_ID=MMETSP0308-20130426/49807_1 /TAXON_ID=38269 /ORGANISM="Gloeochaete witrockiana, Strain SAG 46.84" /LENGTH=117 /DNA_ID=CAMNT_0027106759 /DNA_START=247 /DNA_END=598 /DNA_ORIENTATION=+
MSGGVKPEFGPLEFDLEGEGTSTITAAAGESLFEHSLDVISRSIVGGLVGSRDELKGDEVVMVREVVMEELFIDIESVGEGREMETGEEVEEDDDDWLLVSIMMADMEDEHVADSEW